ncbi:hypothetical protein [Microbaculum marinum]|uniref:Uncharacterized protein n=1 Tax=Microbaculum marinum TaxID=1764581 RepID=A0AAW9RMM0_9HYPH
MLTTRTMIALSAVAATGIVFLTQPSHSEQTVGVDTVKIQDRHPAFNVGEAMRGALDAERNGTAQEIPSSTPKHDRLDVIVDNRDCGSYTWPKIPASCLNAGDDAVTPRTVSIDHRPSERLSIVTPAATVVAQR